MILHHPMISHNRTIKAIFYTENAFVFSPASCPPFEGNLLHTHFLNCNPDQDWKGSTFFNQTFRKAGMTHFSSSLVLMQDNLCNRLKFPPY